MYVDIRSGSPHCAVDMVSSACVHSITSRKERLWNCDDKKIHTGFPQQRNPSRSVPPFPASHPEDVPKFMNHSGSILPGLRLVRPLYPVGAGVSHSAAGCHPFPQDKVVVVGSISVVQRRCGSVMLGPWVYKYLDDAVQ